MPDATPEIVPDQFDLLRRMNEAFKAAGQCVDASLHSVRQELGQNIEQPVRIINARFSRPVGREDLLLHPAAVKAAKGKPVDRKYVAVVRVEPDAEKAER